MYDPNQPYPSQRSPIAARNLVATSQPLATQAGIRALRRGGNAIDAALSAAITLTVVEPNNNGVGSDAFCIIGQPGEDLVGLNASGRSPRGWNLERFSGRETMPTLGWDAVTVPGCVSAWVELSERYGQLSFEDLFEDAIHYAHEGFHVGPKSAYYWQLLEKMYQKFADFSDHFLPAPKAGELFKRRELATTLKLIAQSRGEAFYHGELAEKIVAASAAAGGALDLEDLAAHENDWVTPTQQAYRGVELHEIPPNGQGLAAQIALGILEFLPAAPVDSTQWAHLQIEAMKVAIRASFDHFADPRAMTVSIDDLLAPSSLEQIAKSVDPNRAAPLPPVRLPVGKDTVYLTTADANGMMVSFIQSNFMAFGSGVVIPGTGISMQNRGSGFVLDADHPNCVAGSKRPFHTIIPGFVTRDGAPLMSFGVMGGHMQHQGHVQMVSRICEHGQNPQAASDAPRWHLTPDYEVLLEQGYDAQVQEELAALGHAVRSDSTESTFGGAQLILRTENGYVGGSDHRKEGQIAGY